MLTIRSTLAVLGGALALAACGGTEPSCCGSFTLAGSRQVLAGSEVHLQGADFRGVPDSLVRVEVDTTALPTRRVDDTTFAVRLPDTAAVLQLALRLRDRRLPLDVAVTTYGYTGSSDLPMDDAYFRLPYRRSPHAVLVTSSPSGLGWYELDTRTVRHFGPGNEDWKIRAPGMTYDGMLLAPNPARGDTVEVWSPTNPAQLVGSLGVVPGGGWWQLVALGPDTLLHFSKVDHRLFTRPAADQPWQWGLWETSGQAFGGVSFSPRGDRAVVGVYFDLGFTVFAMPSGAAAYRIQDLPRVWDSDFSADGELLALVAEQAQRDTAAPGTLRVVRAATGEVVADSAIRGIFAVHFDPARPLLYVGIEVPDTAAGTVPGTTQVVTRPHVLLFDSRTFTRLGELRPPRTAPDCRTGCGAFTKILTSGEPAIYVAGSNGALTVWRFTLPPAGSAP